jgi:signal transduction histidine kinase
MKQQLKHILVRQWLLFTSVFIFMFLLAMFFFMFIFEDNSNDKAVSTVAEMLAQQDEMTYVPNNFALYAHKQVPVEFLQVVEKMQLNQVQEFEVYHLLLFTSQVNNQPWLLVYDTSGHKTVWGVSDKILLLLSPLIMLFLLIAYLLAKRFTKTISSNLEGLLNNVRAAATPSELVAYAKQQKIDEFSAMALQHADIWQQKLDLIENEKNALAYLSHEMRTPLQVIQSSTELIGIDQNNHGALERLARAVTRLSRLSTSILWLMGKTDSCEPMCCQVNVICAPLLEEFTLLATAKQQSVELQQSADFVLAAPDEVVETLLSSVILNAIQHGCACTIKVQITEQNLVVENQLTNSSQTPGFGIGMALALKLAEKFKLSITHQIIAESGMGESTMRVVISGIDQNTSAINAI